MITSLRITTLVDNTALYGSRYWAEHGLSFLIEADGEKILFDTGQSSEVIAHNLGRLKEDLSNLNFIVLSHGHYDHTGGLKEVLERAPEAEIFAHPNIFDDKYGKRDDRYIPIGIPFNKDELENEHKFTLTEEPIDIGESVKTTGQIPRKSLFEQVGDVFYIKKENEYIKDDILDDQALILSTKKGIWVILGCTHSGLVNTLHHVEKMTGHDKIEGLIGGTHLIGASEERLEGTVQALKSLNVGSIFLSHCTGAKAFFYLSHELGPEKVSLTYSGLVIEVQ